MLSKSEVVPVPLVPPVPSVPPVTVNFEGVHLLSKSEAVHEFIQQSSDCLRAQKAVGKKESEFLE